MNKYFKLCRLSLNLLLVFALFLISCKKESTGSYTLENDSGVLLARDLTITQQEVINWLEEQMDPNAEVKNEFINSLIEHADFDNMWAERYTDPITLIVAPISPVYFSQHVDSGKEPFQYLILWETSGNFYKAEVVLFYPEDLGFEGFIEGDFQYMYGGSVCETDGKFEMLNLSDRKELEIEYSSGKPSTSVTMLINDEHESLSGRDNCTFITVVRWYYDLSTYEIIGYDILWEGEVCGNDCLPDEINCDSPDGRGGSWGGEEDSGTPMSPELTFLVDRRKAGSAIHEIIAKYNTTGTKYNVRTRNTFTTVTQYGVPALWFIGGSFYQFEASEIGHGHPWFAEWAQTTHNEVIQAEGTQAWVHVSGFITYPNQNPDSDPNARPPLGRQVFIANGHRFYAKDY